MNALHYKPTDDELRDVWLRKYPDTIFTRGQFYRYFDGIWCPLDEMRVRDEIADILISAKEKGVVPSTPRVNSVLGLTIPKIHKDANLLDSKLDLFAFKNGVMNLKTQKFSKHSKDNYVSTVVDYDYNPNSTCPNFMKVIRRFDNGVQALLQEFMGYCLTTETHHEIMLWLYGPPGSGKSTLIKGFETLLGGYCTNLPPRCFDEDRFGKVGLIGARLACAYEVPKKGINDTADLKAIVSGEAVYIEAKHKNGFSLSTWVKILWAMNYLPRIDTIRDGLGRRIKIIICPQIPEDERDPNFTNMIAEEGPGIFNFALQGLISLHKRGKFNIPASVTQALKQCPNTSSTEPTPDDLIKRFIEEHCMKSNGQKVQAGRLGDAIRIYCRKLGIKEPNSTEISAGMLKLNYRKSKHNGKYFYHGLTVISNDD